MAKANSNCDTRASEVVRAFQIRYNSRAEEDDRVRDGLEFYLRLSYPDRKTLKAYVSQNGFIDFASCLTKAEEILASSPSGIAGMVGRELVRGWYKAVCVSLTDRERRRYLNPPGDNGVEKQHARL